MREPLVQFLFLALVAFGINSWVNHGEQNNTKLIISEKLRSQLFHRYELQFGMQPSLSEQNRIVEQYIESELLYREAERLKLSVGDDMVRQRMIQLMQQRFDSQVVSDVEEETLENFYTEHPEYFSLPARLNFSQLFFRIDPASLTLAKERATSALSQLKLVKDPTGIQSDNFAMGRDFKAMTSVNLRSTFGQSELSEQLILLLDDPTKISSMDQDWFGPLQSGYGVHLLRITGYTPEEIKPFADIKNEVYQIYQSIRLRENSQHQLNMLREKYEIQY
jgi:hypothetical protein